LLEVNLCITKHLFNAWPDARVSTFFGDTYLTYGTLLQNHMYLTFITSSNAYNIEQLIFFMLNIQHFTSKSYVLLQTLYFSTVSIVLLLLKNNISKTLFCLRLQVKPTQLGAIDRASPCLRRPEAPVIHCLQMSKKCPVTSSTLNSRPKVQTESSYFPFFARYY
jgi:hypothetical protein